jgi:hypothetical protein
VNVLPLNETVQLVQQFVCVLPLTVPVKHDPPTIVPASSDTTGAPASTSAPLDPDMAKMAVPLGGFGAICHESSISEAETVVTVIVALDVVLPVSLFGDVFWYVPENVALYTPLKLVVLLLLLLLPPLEVLLVHAARKTNGARERVRYVMCGDRQRAGEECQPPHRAYTASTRTPGKYLRSFSRSPVSDVYTTSPRDAADAITTASMGLADFTDAKASPAACANAE